MTSATVAPPAEREAELLRQTVVVIGGSAGMAAGFVDTLLSASLVGDQLDKRRSQLRATLPSRASSARPTFRRSPCM